MNSLILTLLLACTAKGTPDDTASGTTGTTDGGSDGGSGSDGGGQTSTTAPLADSELASRVDDLPAIPPRWYQLDLLDLSPDRPDFVGPMRTYAAGDQIWATSLHSPAVLQLDAAKGVVEAVYPINFLSGHNPLAVDVSSQSLWVVGNMTQPLTLVDMNTGHNSLVDIEDLLSVSDVAWDTTGRALLVWGENKAGAELLRIAADNSRSLLPLGGDALALSIDADSRRAVLSSARAGGAGTLHEVDLDSLELLRSMDLDSLTSKILVTADQIYFAQGNMLLSWGDADPSPVLSIDFTIEQMAQDKDGALWTIHRQSFLDEASGIVWGELAQLAEDGEGLTYDGGYNSQYMTYMPTLDTFASNSEGSCEIFLTSRDGEQRRVQTGHSAGVARSAPDRAEQVAVVDRLGEHVHFFEDGHEVARYDSQGWPLDLTWGADSDIVYVYEHHLDAVVAVDPTTGVGSTIFDDDATNSAVVFGSIIRSGDVLYVVSGSTDVVRALSLDGTLLWQTDLGDPQPFKNNDQPASVDIGVDGEGRLWTLRSRDGRVVSLTADGEIRDGFFLSAPTDLHVLFVQGDEIYAGPWKIDPDLIAVEEGADVLDAAAMLADGDQGTLLLDSADALVWQPTDGATPEIYDFADLSIGGNYRLAWSDSAQGVWVSSFGDGQTRLLGWR